MKGGEKSEEVKKKEKLKNGLCFPNHDKEEMVTADEADERTCLLLQECTFCETNQIETGLN